MKKKKKLQVESMCMLDNYWQDMFILMEIIILYDNSKDMAINPPPVDLGQTHCF